MATIILSIICIPLTIVSIFAGCNICITGALATVPVIALLKNSSTNEGGSDMSILNRFTDIIKANINDLLDRAEDPAKMIDQYLFNLNADLAKVKQETAGVMAQETRARKAYEAKKDEVDKYEGLAARALKDGNEEHARTFISKKQVLEEECADLKATYDIAAVNAKKIRKMHDKLVSDIDQLHAKRDAIKAKVAIAKTQQNINKMTVTTKKTGNVVSAFQRMEEKANSMLNQANAMEELNKEPVDEAAKLEKEYTRAGKTASVEEELERLKQLSRN